MRVTFYADDLKMLSIITKVAGCTQQQLTVKRLLNWCENNKLLLNILKCHRLRNVRENVCEKWREKWM